MRFRTRTAVLLNAVVLMSTGVALAGGGTAQATNFGPEISNHGSFGCLTVPDASQVTHTRVIQSTCLGVATPNTGQHWALEGPNNNFIQVLNLETGLCLGVESLENFGAVWQQTCDLSESSNGWWQLTDVDKGNAERTIRLKVTTGNFCLDLENGDRSDGVPLQVWQCNTRTNNQKWDITTRI